jgi:hypothetical protein
MIRILLVLTLLAGCSSLGTAALKTLTSSGPSVNANAQLGKENRQTLTFGSVEEVRGNKEERVVQADKVETVVVNEMPAWVILLLILGWLMPSPQEMVRGFYSLFTSKK